MMKKIISLILAIIFIFSSFSILVSAEDDTVSEYEIGIISTEYGYDICNIYADAESRYYMGVYDIARYTRSEYSESDGKIKLTHGVREIIIDPAKEVIIDNNKRDSINLIVNEGQLLIHAAPILTYLGATCDVINNRLVIAMPSYTMWEALELTGYENYITSEDAFGDEASIKTRLLFNGILKLMESGVGDAINAEYRSLLLALQLDVSNYDQYFEIKANDEIKNLEFIQSTMEKANAPKDLADFAESVETSVKAISFFSESKIIDKVADISALPLSVAISSASSIAETLKCSKDSFDIVSATTRHMSDEARFYNNLSHAQKKLASTEDNIKESIYSNAILEVITDKLSDTLKKKVDDISSAYLKKLGRSAKLSVSATLEASLDISVLLAKAIAGENSRFNYADAETKVIELLRLKEDLADTINDLAEEIQEDNYSDSEDLEDFRLLRVFYYRTLIAINEQFEKMIVSQWGKENTPEMRELIETLQQQSGMFAEKLYMLTVADFSKPTSIRAAEGGNAWDCRITPPTKPFDDSSVSTSDGVIDTPYYTLTVPETWKDKFTVELYSDLYEEIYDLSIRERISAEEEYPGYIFSLYMRKASDDLYTPGARIIRRFILDGEKYDIWLVTPTDFDVAPGGVENYTVMQEGLNSVVSSLEFKSVVTEVSLENEDDEDTDEGEASSTENLTYVVSEDGVKITGVINKSVKKIIIPETIESLPVTEIADQAFTNCTQIERITLPDTLTRIGEYAFYGCTDLSSINLPDGIKKIGRGAFAQCYAIESVKIPSGVDAIQAATFSDCYRIYSVLLPDSLVYIGEGAFQRCTSLTSIVIPEGVTLIDSYAFSNCYKLIEVCNKSELNIEAGSTEHGLVGCYAKSIIKNEKDSRIKNIDGFDFYFGGDENYLLGYIGKDSRISLPETANSVTYSILSYAFYKNNNITEVSIPGSVASIPEYAFADCDSLAYVTMGSGIISIEKSAFNGCTSLRGIELSSSLQSIGSMAFAFCENLSKVVIPSSVVSIGTSAFNECSGLIQVVVGANVTSIGQSAFRYCYKLVEVVNYSDKIHLWQGMDTNGGLAKYAKQIISDAADSAIRRTDDGFTFYDGEAVYLMSYDGSDRNLTLPNGLGGKSYEIYDFAFYYDENIVELTIPSRVTAIGKAAFCGLDNLSRVVIHDGLISIGEDAFGGCDNLKVIYMPKTLQTVGEKAFEYSESLKEVHISDVDAWCKIDFYDVYSNPVYLAHSLYLNGELLTDLVISDGVQSIGSYAFVYCYSIEKIVFSNSVVEIGREAFFNCINLKELTFGTGLRTIGAESFVCCEALDTVIIPNSVSIIEERAFYACGRSFYSDCGLKTLVIGSGVTYIGADAFDDCFSLEAVFYAGTKSQAASITLKSNELSSKSIYYYSQFEPTEEGLYWRYVDGTPTAW